MYSLRTGASAVCTLILVVWANDPAAQEPQAGSSQDSSTMSLPPVEVTAIGSVFLTPPPFDVEKDPNGQPVTTIGRDRYDNQPAFSAGEILRQSPGVSVKQGNGRAMSVSRSAGPMHGSASASAISRCSRTGSR
jgi:hypothetical protein